MDERKQDIMRVRGGGETGDERGVEEKEKERVEVLG